MLDFGTGGYDHRDSRSCGNLEVQLPFPLDLLLHGSAVLQYDQRTHTAPGAMQLARRQSVHGGAQGQREICFRWSGCKFFLLRRVHRANPLELRTLARDNLPPKASCHNNFRGYKQLGVNFSFFFLEKWATKFHTLYECLYCLSCNHIITEDHWGKIIGSWSRSFSQSITLSGFIEK